MGNTSLEAAFSKCIPLYFEPSVPGSTLREVFDVVGDHNRYPKDLANPVYRNPAVTQLIFRTDFLQTRIQEWIAEAPEGQYNPRVILERIFTLLGRQASRNLVACIQVQKTLGILPRKKNDRMALVPSEQIRYGVAAEEFCQSRGFAFSEWAFIGGFHFDLLSAALQKQKGPRDAINIIPNVWSESLKTAHAAYEIGAHLGDFTYNSHLFASAAALGCGKILMHALFPKELLAGSYNAFLADADKLKTGKWQHLDHREQPRFGTCAAELAGLYVSWVGLVRELEAAITYSGEPYQLRTSAPGRFKIASILHLSQAVAAMRPLAPSHKKALQDLGISSTTLTEVQKKVQARA